MAIRAFTHNATVRMRKLISRVCIVAIILQSGEIYSIQSFSSFVSNLPETNTLTYFLGHHGGGPATHTVSIILFIVLSG